MELTEPRARRVMPEPTVPRARKATSEFLLKAKKAIPESMELTDPRVRRAIPERERKVKKETPVLEPRARRAKTVPTEQTGRRARKATLALKRRV